MNYKITLSAEMDAELISLTNSLSISHADLFKRAILLLKHAAQADKVMLISNNKEQQVLIK